MQRLWPLALVGVIFLSPIGPTVFAQGPAVIRIKVAAPKLAASKLGDTRPVHSFGTTLLCGQPSADDFAAAKKAGLKTVISLRPVGESDWDETETVKGLGLNFYRFGFGPPDSLTDEIFDGVRKVLRDKQKTPTMLHCASAKRVGAVWLVHRVLDDGVPLEEAIDEAQMVGLASKGYLEKAHSYIKRNVGPRSVRPGINNNFLKADLDIKQWLGRFEIESREVFGSRRAVLKATGIQAGDRVADIGAGTGFFSRLFAETVGPEGWVYAVDISPSFLKHINEQAQADKLTNLTTVLAPQDSISLAPNSIDVAFTCDTYHHFEYPQLSLASIRRALKPGGTLVIIDFDRIPGKSSKFIMGHVRAGKKEFRREIESAGFTFLDELEVDGLKENYFLRFKSD